MIRGAKDYSYNNLCCSMPNPEGTDNGPLELYPTRQPISDADIPTASDRDHLPIRVRIGEPFCPFESRKLEEVETGKGIFEFPFVLENIGEGNIALLSMYESFQEGDPLSIFEAYDSPLDSLQITRSALPDIPKAERKTIYPLEIIGAYLTLVQRKEISPPPTLALKFDSTPYQYWATDIAEDEPQRASYADWRLERHEDIRVIAVNRKPEELARIYITFFLQS